MIFYSENPIFTQKLCRNKIFLLFIYIPKISLISSDIPIFGNIFSDIPIFDPPIAPPIKTWGVHFSSKDWE